MTRLWRQYCFASAITLCSSAVFAADDREQQVPFTSMAPEIDGQVEADIWSSAAWRQMDHLMAGTLPSPQDFEGRYKLLWDHSRLYILAEITDDILIDTHPDPLDSYWDDDCLEIFIDEDATGGIHQFDHSAFAYHVALDGQVADIGTGGTPADPEFILFNDHLASAWKRSPDAPHRMYWEVALKIFDDSFRQADPDPKPVKLQAGKQMGFMLAYCDADSAAGREHFMGSHEIAPVNGDRNRGYIDASVFGKVTLVSVPSK